MTEIAFLTEELALSPDAKFTSSPNGNQARTWIFAGIKENRTYARAASSQGISVKFDALSVQATAAALASIGNNKSIVELTEKRRSDFSEGIKFPYFFILIDL